VFSGPEILMAFSKLQIKQLRNVASVYVNFILPNGVSIFAQVVVFQQNEVRNRSDIDVILSGAVWAGVSFYTARIVQCPGLAGIK